MTFVMLKALILAEIWTVIEDTDSDNMMLELRGNQFIFPHYTY